jgi:hypothetical protein
VYFGLKASGGGDDHITLGSAAVLVDGFGNDAHELAQTTVKGVGVGIAEAVDLAALGLQIFAFGVLPKLLGTENWPSGVAEWMRTIWVVWSDSNVPRRYQV